MEEAPENGKELSHSAHASGMNEWIKMSQNRSESWILKIRTIIIEFMYVCLFVMTVIFFRLNLLPVRHGLIHNYNNFNPFNAKLNPICHLLALLGAHHILHVSRIKVKWIWSIWCINENNYSLHMLQDILWVQKWLWTLWQSVRSCLVKI